jgi:tetratricopeptide (TPR) repeat protein
MFEELIHSIMEQWSNVATTFFSGIDAPRILSVLIPIVPASYGVYIKWRNSGYRLVDRLEEFLEDQEKRLDKARSQLTALVEFPDPGDPADQPIFSSRSLSKALRRMHWGFGQAATNDLAGAAQLSADQARLSEKLKAEHLQREILANLLLGAKAASRQISDPAERNAVRSEALEHFDKALAIDSNDADALEYSGMMLLELNEPMLALQRFSKLIACRKKAGGGAALARAFRLQAMAYERQVPPRNTPAYDALTRATEELPPGCTLDHAVTYEHLALVAKKLSFTARYPQNLRIAWNYYHSLRNSVEGKRGLDRVSAKIAQLDGLAPSAKSNETSESHARAVVTVPGFTANLFSRLTKPTG